jgi:hypothetical protein
MTLRDAELLYPRLKFPPQEDNRAAHDFFD